MEFLNIEKEILFDILNNPDDTFYENVLSDFLDERGVEHDFRKPLHNNKIAELKPCQEKCLDIWRSYWINFGTSVKLTNEEKVEKYFFDFYKQLKLGNFRKVVWFDNPIELNIVNDKSIFFEIDELKKQIWNCLKEQVFSETWYKIYNILWYDVWYQTWIKKDNRIWKNHQFCQKNLCWLACFDYLMKVLEEC
jgi:hypothetical protein